MQKQDEMNGHRERAKHVMIEEQMHLCPSTQNQRDTQNTHKTRYKLDNKYRTTTLCKLTVQTLIHTYIHTNIETYCIHSKCWQTLHTQRHGTKQGTTPSPQTPHVKMLSVYLWQRLQWSSSPLPPHIHRLHRQTGCTCWWWVSVCCPRTQTHTWHDRQTGAERDTGDRVSLTQLIDKWMTHTLI